MRRGKKFHLIFLVLLIITGTIVNGSCNTTFGSVVEFKTENPEVEKIDGMVDTIKIQNVFRQIAKTVMPAVVSIEVESEVVVRNPYADLFGNDPFFRRYFNGPEGNTQRVQAQGSGIIFSKDGYIFSNNHVIDGAIRILIVLSDGREFEAEVVGVDPETDIAILKIDIDEELPYAAIGNSSEVQVGDWALAIGNPFGLIGTYTFGIISAIKRPGMESDYQSLIQTDTAVNPGNSGGPLVNIKGQVIGINTAIQSQTGGYMGISYAIPINIAKNVALQIIENGEVSRGFLGITAQNIDPETKEMLGLDYNEGVSVSKVDSGSAAESVGLERGDIITKINGESIGEIGELLSSIGNFAPDMEIELEILKTGGERVTLNVLLGVRPVAQRPTRGGNRVEDTEDETSESFEFLGAKFENAPEDVLKANGADYGVMIGSIPRSSSISGILRRNDIIVAINRTKIKGLDDLKKFAELNGDARSYTFQIVREGYLYYKGVTPDRE